MNTMKKLISGFVIVSAILCLSLVSDNHENTGEKYVYICNNKAVGKYHLSENCRGLNACTHGIVKVTLTEARNNGKKELCGWED